MTIRPAPLRDAAMALQFDLMQKDLPVSKVLAGKLSSATMMWGSATESYGGDYIGTHAVKLHRLLVAEAWRGAIFDKALADLTLLIDELRQHLEEETR